MGTVNEAIGESILMDLEDFQFVAMETIIKIYDISSHNLLKYCTGKRGNLPLVVGFIE